MASIGGRLVFHLLAFGVRRSAFGVRRAAFGVRRAAVLWVLLVVFEWKVFRPVLERSLRVFEIEALNRTIGRLASGGFRSARERRNAATT